VLWLWEIAGHHNLCSFPETGALFAMQDTRWDHALKVTGGGTGLVGHAGAVLLHKAADQAGLTAALSAALRKAGSSPLLDRGIVLVSMAAAIALGATSMSDIAMLAHLAPVFGDAPPQSATQVGLPSDAISGRRDQRAPPAPPGRLGPPGGRGQRLTCGHLALKKSRKSGSGRVGPHRKPTDETALPGTRRHGC
jgi:hypothetical protein